ncbi:acylglycerol lipase [Aureococcus anophagefferens]|nr:acylglycerol lipase [Aureococcus anophagefferens]
MLSGLDAGGALSTRRDPNVRLARIQMARALSIELWMLWQGFCEHKRCRPRVSSAAAGVQPAMDFLDFEDNRVAEILEQVENGTLTAEDGVIELLDEDDLLQELRANADLVTFFRDHPEAVVACALVRDGEGQSGDTETLEPDKPTRRDRRGGVAAEVLTGDDGVLVPARCAGVADALAAPDALNFYVDRFFDLPACTMLHNAVTAAVLAVLADEPRRADAAAVLDALLFRTGECAHSDDASRGLLKRAAHAIRVARADGRHVTLSRDANLVVIAEAVCAALRQDPDDGGDREPLIPDLLFRRRPELDAWLHFAASVLSLETARKVVLAEPPKSSFRDVR